MPARPATRAKPPHTTANAVRCACGGGCPRCARSDISRVPDLSIPVGPADDRHERQAAQVAIAVAAGVRAPAALLPSRAPPRAHAVDVGATLASDDVGAPLAASTRADMETRLHADFGDVRMHTGAAARALNARYDARAFTVGSHLFFSDAADVQRPGLMAHELTHSLQQRASIGPTIQRTPRVANMDWRVDHSDVAGGDEVDMLTDIFRGLGLFTARLNALIAERRSGWAANKALYVRAFDFLRDNAALFDVPNTFDLMQRTYAFCDSTSVTVATLSDDFYRDLLIFAVYSPSPTAATFTHRSGSTYGVAGRASTATDFAPSGDDPLLRASPTADTTVTGGFSARTDLLVSYGAQQGSVATASVNLVVDRYRAHIPARLRPILSEVATDPTLLSVLQRFLADDGGGFRLEPVGVGGAHYTRARPPSIEVDPDLFPGSGASREMSAIGLRATLVHELYHYALDRADAAITEVGRESDHRLISLIEDRYTIIAMVRAGQAPTTSDIEALQGYVGGDPKPALRDFVARDDRTGLRSYVRTQDFLDSTVFTVLVTAVSGNEGRMAGTVGHVSDFLHDPSQITDLAYLAAINGVILRKAFEIAADIADSTSTPLASVWAHADYQTRMQTTLARLIALAAHNRTEGIVALAAAI